MQTKLFDYNLPEELIAQYPADRRGESRMLVLDRISGKTEIHPFSDIVDYLQPGDLIVCNNTRVMNARLYGLKGGSPEGAKIEALLTSVNPSGSWKCLLKPGKRVRPGVSVKLLNRAGELLPDNPSFTVLNHRDDGSYEIKFDTSNAEKMMACCGHVPLPPYIKRSDETDDFERYQTIFAKRPGAVAAPTAGLHFTSDVMEKITNKGLKTTAVTLHVGPGTFKPVEVDDVSNHQMHSESFELTQATADLINQTHQTGNRVIAIGTTTVRVLESCAAPDGTVSARSGWTDIFLYPPYKPRAVDTLLTNFHLPKSTLLMLVSTFAGREHVMAAYRQAAEAQMRFYSYGDCMLLK
jgi:S-adenosylmethionine:tRNA ribosyltransferase-isomerase